MEKEECGTYEYITVHIRTYSRAHNTKSQWLVQEDPWIDESIHGSTERSAPRAEEQSQNKRMHNVVAAVSLSP